jgi:hypothetical protein
MEFMDPFPIWALYIGVVITVLIAAELGFRIGIWLQDRSPGTDDSRMTGTVVGGMLGLVAFLMAFSIGIVINQHDDRKTIVLTEANAISTAWLRAGFLAEPDLTSSRDLLREYTEMRLAAAADQTQLPAMIARSEEIHSELWSIMEENVSSGYKLDVMTLVIESINDVIDVHSEHLFVGTKRLPTVLTMVLLAATVLAFVSVGVASSVDRKRDPAAIMLFALIFVAVLIVIVDLNRPFEGTITISQTAMANLLRQMSPPGQ